MSLSTSLHPSTHGVQMGRGGLAPHVTTLAQALRAAGFETGAVTENGALAVDRGFGRGFDSYLENKSPDESPAVGLVEQAFATALQWLERRRDRRRTATEAPESAPTVPRRTGLLALRVSPEWRTLGKCPGCSSSSR